MEIWKTDWSALHDWKACSTVRKRKIPQADFLKLCFYFLCFWCNDTYSSWQHINPICSIGSRMLSFFFFFFFSIWYATWPPMSSMGEIHTRRWFLQVRQWIPNVRSSKLCKLKSKKGRIAHWIGQMACGYWLSLICRMHFFEITVPLHNLGSTWF